MCAHVCVGVRVGDRRYCQQRSPSAAVEAKSICWFLDVVEKPEVIMQTGRPKSRENQGGMRGEEEDWEPGKRDYTPGIRAKAARPSSWALLSTFYN